MLCTTSVTVPPAVMWKRALTRLASLMADLQAAEKLQVFRSGPGVKRLLLSAQLSPVLVRLKR